MLQILQNTKSVHFVNDTRVQSSWYITRMLLMSIMTNDSNGFCDVLTNHIQVTVYVFEKYTYFQFLVIEETPSKLIHVVLTTQFLDSERHNFTIIYYYNFFYFL